MPYPAKERAAKHIGPALREFQSDDDKSASLEAKPEPGPGGTERMEHCTHWKGEGSQDPQPDSTESSGARNCTPFAHGEQPLSHASQSLAVALHPTRAAAKPSG